MKIKRIPNIYYGEMITSDPKGSNFAVLQRHHKIHLYKHYPTLERDPMDSVQIWHHNSIQTHVTYVNPELQLLLSEADDQDCIHDVEFVVG